MLRMKETNKIILFAFLIFVSAKAFCGDSTYLLKDYKIKIKSPFLYKGTSSIHEYSKTISQEFSESSDQNSLYFAQLIITDCRIKILGKPADSVLKFIHGYKDWVFDSFYPAPAIIQYKNMQCYTRKIKRKVTVNDGEKILAKNKSVIIKYLLFFRGNFIYEIFITDRKTNIEGSFDNFLNRIDFID